jgi:hypothetical protein
MDGGAGGSWQQLHPLSSVNTPASYTIGFGVEGGADLLDESRSC